MGMEDAAWRAGGSSSGRAGQRRGTCSRRLCHECSKQGEVAEKVGGARRAHAGLRCSAAAAAAALAEANLTTGGSQGGRLGIALALGLRHRKVGR